MTLNPIERCDSHRVVTVSGVTFIKLLIVCWLPGAVIFRLPIADRDRRAGLDAEERLFWAVILSAAVSLSVVLGAGRGAPLQLRTLAPRRYRRSRSWPRPPAGSGCASGASARRPALRACCRSRSSCSGSGASFRRRSTSSVARIRACT